MSLLYPFGCKMQPNGYSEFSIRTRTDRRAHETAHGIDNRFHEWDRKGIALRLAKEGVHVVVTGRDAGRGEEVASLIRTAGGEADFIMADIGASAEAARALAHQSAAALGGRIDILVNNAGVYPVGPTAQVSDETLDMMLALNIRAPHALVAAIAPMMAEHGGGVIINIGSWMGSLGIPISALYGATKVALEQMSRSWAAEYGHSGVRVNSIAPGVILTEGNEGSRAVIDQMVAPTPAGRAGTRRTSRRQCRFWRARMPRSSMRQPFPLTEVFCTRHPGNLPVRVCPCRAPSIKPPLRNTSELSEKLVVFHGRIVRSPNSPD